MTNQTQPFEMSIEPVGGIVHRNGYHLGTDERLARELCEERFHGRNKAGMATVTIALMRGNDMIDVYDGSWSSQEMTRTESSPIYEASAGDTTYRAYRLEQNWLDEDDEPMTLIQYVVRTSSENGTTERARFAEFLDAREWIDGKTR